MRRDVMRAMAVVLVAIGASFPHTRAAETGTITGTLDEPKAVATISAIDRATGKTYPGIVDAASGRFTIAHLPANPTARYDCRIDYRDGARREGIDLKVPPSEYEEEQPLSSDDVAAIKAQINALNQFEDEVEILTVFGNIQHAAVLINKVRTRPFVNSKPGEVVWRAELWHFERPEETWVKSQDELFLVLYRQRLPKDEYTRKSLTFDPALGGISVNTTQPVSLPHAIRRPPAQPGVRLASAEKKEERRTKDECLMPDDQ